MPADDPGLEFEEDLEEEPPAPRAAPAAAGRRDPAPTKDRAPGPGAAKAGRTGAPRQGGAKRGVRGLRGKHAPPKRERPKVTVRVVGLDRSFEVEEGTDLLRACKDNHVNVFWGPWAQAFNCRGVAACGLCKVQVVAGADHVSPRTKKEAKRLRGKPDDWRLACHAKLTGDVRIDPFPRIPIDEQVGEEAIRRALLTEEEREELRRNAQSARQAEREDAKGAPAAPKERKGLLARLQKGDRDDGAPGNANKGRDKKDKGEAAGRKGLLSKAKGKAKRKGNGSEKGKDGTKGRTRGDKAADGRGAATDDTADARAKDAGASGKRSFGLKGRK